MGFEAKRTQVAQTAFDFAQYFTDAMDAVRVEGPTPLRPILAKPEGMSTGGGKLARQAIVLAAEGGGGNVTAGWVDLQERKAMLRTYGCLEGLHRTRYRGRPFDLDRTSFENFHSVATTILGDCGLAVILESDATTATPSVRPPRAAARRQAESGPSQTTLIAIIAFLIGLIVGGTAVYLRLRGFR